MVRKRKLGPSFPDEVAKVTAKMGHFKKIADNRWEDQLLPNFNGRFGEKFTKSPWAVLPYSLICIFLFFVIFLRMFHLQIIEGAKNRKLADGNRIQIKIIHAPRGVIFDRNGKILAANSPAFRLAQNQQSNTKKVKFLSREQALEMEVKNDPQAVNLEVDNVRAYPLEEKLAHVLGMVGEISDEQLKSEEYKGYKLGDMMGKSGIEFQYEKELKGIDGGEIIEVDSKGAPIRALRRNLPIPGKNIYLTIDALLQEKIYEQLTQTLTKTGSCCAAAAAIDPKSGQILALVSLPSYNPNIFTSQIDEAAIAQVLSRVDSPILNRVIAGTYPPGSTFKIISALAALSSGKITAGSAFMDNGVIYLGSFKFTNWYFTQYGKTEGMVNLLKAIQRSNDIYFYEVSRIIGEEKLAEWSSKLFLGKQLGIDLPGEAKGIVPNDEWKRKTFGEGWYPGDTLHMAIGQGFVLTTPLQILGITSAIASGGVLYRPQLKLTDFKADTLVSSVASAKEFNLVKEGLKLVPKTGGTAWPFFTFPIPTAGKTGTAEFGDSKDRTHAWYTAFGPADSPEIAMTVLVEGGGEGSSVAAPVVKEAFRWYFSEDKNKLIQDVYIQATDSAKTLGE